jgi:ribonuclease HII
MVALKRKPNFPRQLYEKQAWAQSQYICGVDEVGRSSLAGPVVAAAVILKPHARYKLLKDSKLLTVQERLKAYTWLIKNSTFAVGIMHHRIIDKVNIHNATLQAMKKAVVQLLAQQQQNPSLILVDAMPLACDDLGIPVIYFCYGERQSASIAAASIIAKVTRDALMGRIDTFLPGYSFLSNKGYGTATHKKALKDQGSLIMHRMSFLRFLTHSSPPSGPT